MLAERRLRKAANKQVSLRQSNMIQAQDGHVEEESIRRLREDSLVKQAVDASGEGKAKRQRHSDFESPKEF